MDGYQLGPEALRQIAQLVRDNVRGELARKPKHTDSIQPIYIAKTGTGGIDALSGDTPGTADVTIYRVNSDGDLEAATDSNGDEVSQTAYNLSTAAISANTYISLTQDIVSGKQCVTSSSTKKLFCRFTLDSALATSDSSQSATIQSQWGYGTDHDTETTITVTNLETHTSGTYVFEGDSGDAGIAVYSGSGTTWYIIQMECP